MRLSFRRIAPKVCLDNVDALKQRAHGGHKVWCSSAVNGSEACTPIPEPSYKPATRNELQHCHPDSSLPECSDSSPSAVSTCCSALRKLSRTLLYAKSSSTEGKISFPSECRPANSCYSHHRLLVISSTIASTFSMKGDNEPAVQNLWPSSLAPRLITLTS